MAVRESRSTQIRDKPTYRKTSLLIGRQAGMTGLFFVMLNLVQHLKFCSLIPDLPKVDKSGFVMTIFRSLSLDSARDE